MRERRLLTQIQVGAMLDVHIELRKIYELKQYIKMRIYFRDEKLFSKFKKLVTKPSEFIFQEPQFNVYNKESEKPYLLINKKFLTLLTRVKIFNGKFQGKTYNLNYTVVPDISFKIDKKNNEPRAIPKIEEWNDIESELIKTPSLSLLIIKLDQEQTNSVVVPYSQFFFTKRFFENLHKIL